MSAAKCYCRKLAGVLQISQTGPRCKDLRLFDAQSQRNAMTWADDETFIFDYTCDVAAATSVGEGAISTSPKFARPPCSDDDEEIVYENPAVDDCSRGTETTPAENDEPQPLIFSVSPLRDALRHAADMETQVCRFINVATPRSNRIVERITERVKCKVPIPKQKLRFPAHQISWVIEYGIFLHTLV